MFYDNKYDSIILIVFILVKIDVLSYFCIALKYP